MCRQDDYEERSERADEERDKPPEQAAAAFGLSEAGVDEREGSPTDEVFGVFVHDRFPQWY
jgi:hypothetical protein